LRLGDLAAIGVLAQCANPTLSGGNLPSVDAASAFAHMDGSSGC